MGRMNIYKKICVQYNFELIDTDFHNGIYNFEKEGKHKLKVSKVKDGNANIYTLKDFNDNYIKESRKFNEIKEYIE